MVWYRRFVAVAGAAALVAVGSTAAGATVGPTSPENATPDPATSSDWKRCPEFGTPADQSPLKDVIRCTTIRVPLDYRRPNGRTIEVAVSRLALSRPGERRGVILTNPGGPGGAGLDMPILLAMAGMPESVFGSYDIIGFDPRGIGHSTPLECGFTPEQIARVHPTHPATSDDVADRFAEIRAFAKQCADHDAAGIAPHVTTANTARDMDRIRTMLGEEKVSYFGWSYGSYLGAVYAQLFGDRTDRVVLDSAVGPGLVWRDEFRLFGLGGELAFPDFARWLAERHETYGFGRTTKEVRATYFRLAAKADARPVGSLDGTAFRWATFGILYDPAAYPAGADIWKAVQAGKAPEALAESTRGMLRQTEDNSLAAQNAVLCGDARWPRSVATYQRDVAFDRKVFPLFGAMMANSWICAAWPKEPVEPTVPITDRGPSNILILQNTRDPATTLPGAVQLRQRLGARARMVTVDASGHGVYPLGRNACAFELTTAFLVEGERPDDQHCAAEPAGRTRLGTARSEAVREIHSRQGPLGP